MIAEAPTFPPLLHGVRVPQGDDPLEAAVAAAIAGIDAGAVFWEDRSDLASAALVLAPDVALERAMIMVPTVMVGLGDAIGALAPPKVAVTWAWPDRVRINGAECGVFRAAAEDQRPGDPIGWLVIAFTLQIAPLPGEPGERADITSLTEEGCADLTAGRLIESWARHTLAWINLWEDEGFRPVHESWRGRADDVGREITITHAGVERRGKFLGIDEFGALILETGAGTLALSLPAMLGQRATWPPREIAE